MSRLEELKDEYAKEFDYKDWISFINEQPSWGIEGHMNDICKRYAKECVEASLERASKNSEVFVEGILTKESKKLFTLYDKGVKGVVKRKVFPNKESITNPENIVLI